MSTTPRSFRPTPWLALALLACLASGARAQPFLYALNETGTLTVNGTVLDKLGGSVDAAGEQRWWELFVRGSDRYALRLDGNLSNNGTTLYKLPFDGLELGAWVGLVVTEAHVWALRSDGLLARDGIPVIDYAEDDFGFVTLATDGTSTYALRADGALHRDLVAEPLFRFEGGAGIGGALEGEASDTTWVSLAVDPLDGVPYALRRDGKVVRGDAPEEPTGTLVAVLPFAAVLTPAGAYVDVAFTSDGRWFAVRADGELYDEENLVLPLVDLPGDPDSDVNQTFLEGTELAPGRMVVRYDGRVFVDAVPGSILKLPQGRYRNLELVPDAPDLTNFKNARPVVAQYVAQAVEGTAISVPVLATDTDKESADLALTVDPADLPAGAVWNAEARTLDWAAPGPKGTYKIPVRVDDGVTRTVVSKLVVKVRPADADAAKNKKPQASKVKSARALVGRELRLPILASDMDGDVLTIEPELDKPPFAQGAIFDPDTATVTWTPFLTHMGKYTLVFRISDGTATRKLKVKLQVASSLLSL